LGRIGGIFKSTGCPLCIPMMTSNSNTAIRNTVLRQARESRR
jgi:hypothetical protein